MKDKRQPILMSDADTLWWARRSFLRRKRNPTMVRDDEDRTQFEGIGAMIAVAIREIVTTETPGRWIRSGTKALHDCLYQPASAPRLEASEAHYRKLGISTVQELRERIDNERLDDARRESSKEELQTGSPLLL